MKNLFISTVQATTLKVLGFDEPCFAWTTPNETDFIISPCEKYNGREALMTQTPTYDQAISFLLKLVPRYSYRMCYNDTGEIVSGGEPYDIFNNKGELVDLLIRLVNEKRGN